MRLILPTALDPTATARTLSLADFKFNAIEQSTLCTLQTDLFHSIVLCAYNSSYTFPALPSLINCMRKADKEVSNMTCTEVVSPNTLLHSYRCSQSNTQSIAPPSLFDHFQSEIQRGKAWEIWSCAMTSGRWGGGAGRCSVIYLSRRSVPGVVNNERYQSSTL